MVVYVHILSDISSRKQFNSNALILFFSAAVRIAAIMGKRRCLVYVLTWMFMVNSKASNAKDRYAVFVLSRIDLF